MSPNAHRSIPYPPCPAAFHERLHEPVEFPLDVRERAAVVVPPGIVFAVRTVHLTRIFLAKHGAQQSDYGFGRDTRGPARLRGWHHDCIKIAVIDKNTAGCTRWKCCCI